MKVSVGLVCVVWCVHGVWMHWRGGGGAGSAWHGSRIGMLWTWRGSGSVAVCVGRP